MFLGIEQNHVIKVGLTAVGVPFRDIDIGIRDRGLLELDDLKPFVLGTSGRPVATEKEQC